MNAPKCWELLIAFAPSKEVIGEAINSHFSKHLTKPEQRKDFITEALQNGQFIVVKVFLARTGRPDFETIQSKLNYISVYAVHKAKLLGEQLWNVSAMGDIIDVTDEVLRRFEFTESAILLNHKSPPTHKIKQVGIEQLLRS